MNIKLNYQVVRIMPRSFGKLLSFDCFVVIKHCTCSGSNDESYKMTE